MFIGDDAFDWLWPQLEQVGRDPSTGGYRRFAWNRADLALREWFTATAQARDFDVVTDRAGNLWAWRGNPDEQPGLVIGSHLDSVPDGGAFDGPLGVVSAFAAVDHLDAFDVALDRPLGIACFSDEEGARFGIACAGSRIITGALPADRARALTDADGVSMAEAMAAVGHDPAQVGRDDETLRRIGTFVELHVEQGRALADPDHPAFGHAVAVGEAIWPHGRWRFDLAGRADHAGTTRLIDRDDPMLTLATMINEARAAATNQGCVATVGKVKVLPNGVNAIPSSVTAWLDSRGADPDAVRRTVAAVEAATKTTATQESWTGVTAFETRLAAQLAAWVGGPGGPVPIIATGAGHDAGILTNHGIVAAMLFVRNPTGISHSPEEFAEPADCHEGVRALTMVVQALAGEADDE